MVGVGSSAGGLLKSMQVSDREVDRGSKRMSTDIIDLAIGMNGPPDR